MSSPRQPKTRVVGSKEGKEKKEVFWPYKQTIGKDAFRKRGTLILQLGENTAIAI